MLRVVTDSVSSARPGSKSNGMRISLLVKISAYLERQGPIPLSMDFGLLTQSVLFADTPLPKRNT